MGALASLTNPAIEVEAGQTATIDITVRNTGGVVDLFTPVALGSAAGWMSFEPAALSLFPGAEGTVRMSVRPPRAPESAAGAIPYGVRVVSQEDPAGSVVEEGVLHVAPFIEILPELVPRTSRGSRRGVHELSVNNQGNGRLNAGLYGVHPDEALRFEFKPPTAVCGPGEVQFTEVEVRPVRRFLRGPSISHSFKLFVEHEGAAPIPVDGTMVQEALIPKWLVKALLALLALLIILALLWFTVLKPTIKSSAEDAAEDAVGAPVAALKAQMDEIGKKIGVTPTPLPSPKTAKSPTASASPSPAPSVSPSGISPLGTPFGVRLAASADDQNPSFAVPGNRIISITDVVLMNPFGDSGTLRVRRGDSTILLINLDNFRDLDYHFVAPVAFSGQQIRVEVECTNAVRTPPSTEPCRPSAYFGGFDRKK